MFVVNYDALYWKARALQAEAELDMLEHKYNELLDVSVRQAQTSSDNILCAILAGAFDNVKAIKP